MDKHIKFAQSWSYYSFFYFVLPFFASVIFKSYLIQTICFIAGFLALKKVSVINDGVALAGEYFKILAMRYLVGFNALFLLGIYLYSIFGLNPPLLLIAFPMIGLLLTTMSTINTGIESIKNDN